MKRMFYLLPFIAAAAMSVSVQAQNKSVVPPQGVFPIVEGGVGPVVAGSVEYTQIPLEARKFIDRHFRGLTVMKAEREYDDGTYEIELSDGTDLDFDAKGAWTEVDAPDGYVLASELLGKLLPDKARRELRKHGVEGKVESVKRSPTGYTVDLRGEKVDEYLFASDGRLVGTRD
ncbi:MAG: PepSY-like domain-containing protein [Muribaculaceae bacterium]|nr:PepSY-like domain-containing protein [Muribaculaceae bacterium]